MTDYEEEICDAEKVRISSSFITHAPPGEFSEVFNDVRALLNNDELLKRDEDIKKAFAKYSTDQMLPVSLDGETALITSHGQLANGKFYDPRTRKTFSYDHLRGKADHFEDYDGEMEAENYRSEIDAEFNKYVSNHYPHGVYSVYGSTSGGSPQITLCIEDHRYEPHNFWNGRWRSEWQMTIEGCNANVIGVLKNQVHYYEEGNVQLVSSKECKDTISAENEKQIAADFLKLVSKAEADYQEALSENYNTMSETTFKALRRQLPLTRTKIDWNKILGYKIGKDLSK